MRKGEFVSEIPVYTYECSNGRDIQLYKMDICEIEEGTEFKTVDWYPDHNPIERNFITIDCIYKNQYGVLLMETVNTVYSKGGSNTDTNLVWINRGTR